MANDTVRVAIIGGGLAGATLANALYKLPHIAVNVFESAPEFSERGAAVGLSTNAQAALQESVESLKEVLQKAGSVPIASTRLMIGSGPGAGSLLLDFAGMESEPELIVHRASLLRELLAPLPKDILHPNKKLTKIDTSGDGVTITFEDDTVSQFDAVIGADGVFGTVRSHVVKSDQDQDFSASPGGFWDCRVLAPFDIAKATLGEELFKLDRQYGWLGDGAFIMHDVLENGTLVQMVISAVERDPPKDRKRPLTREFLESTLSSWMEGPIAKGVIDLILEQPNPQGYSQWEHKQTPTYAKGRVCIIGDAAHATTPWQGAGAGQAFEDVMVLAALLKNRVTSPKDIDAAFLAYDAVRRPRGQQVVDSSRGTGTILCGMDPEAGLDPAKLMPALGPRWAFLELDPKAHIAAALEKVAEFS
ncbi:salicylate hydroxylase [Stachybotrys elegans]|uniref:Salicylate hydroxylase n=1 Tax=Stachybotrys elegans TaxID=80388 RepID=A0A8K0T1D0_9HYPO|nr:salicylate hydroxylase [Stachybotrys elegans]